MTRITTRRIDTRGLHFSVDECGTGDKLALCLHGFPESKHSWRHQLPALANMGYRAWAPDLRGYGETSPRPKGASNYAIDELVADVGALIDASGAKETVLLSHDWGALIAWTFASRKIRPLSRLVIMNVPHPKIFAEVAAKSPEQRKRSWYIAFFQLPWIPEMALTANGARGVKRAFYDMAVDKSRFPDEVLQHYADNARIPGAMTAMVNYYRAAFRNRAAMEAGPWPVIETPTLIVWGEEDSALGLELLPGHERFVRDLTVERLPGVSHWVQQEAPEKVNAILKDWLMRPRG